ncbi:MAG TPA: hypothetical protein VGE74_31390 [Gemmata sp.]
MPRVSCPSCGRTLEVEAAYRDWTVRCPHCATEFVPAETAPEQFELEANDRGRYDDDDPRPRRRARQSASACAERDRREVADLTHGPGVWLEICGWCGGLLLAGGALLWLMIGLGAGNNANGNADGAVAVLMGLVSGACAIPYAAIMIVGGRKLRTQSGYGWALAASIVAISSFALCSFVCVFAFVPVIFGIWGAVALNNPLVAEAFDRNQAAGETRWD